MSPLVIVITPEQCERLDEICEESGFSPDMQIGAMIDLEYEEWKDPDDSRLFESARSTRFARFVAQDKDGAS